MLQIEQLQRICFVGDGLNSLHLRRLGNNRLLEQLKKVLFGKSYFLFQRPHGSLMLLNQLLKSIQLT